MGKPKKLNFLKTGDKWEDLYGNVNVVFENFMNSSGNLDESKLSNTLNSLFSSDFSKIKEYLPIFNEYNDDGIDFIHFE